MLSHEVTTSRLERLSKWNWHKTARSCPIEPNPRQSTKRKFGTVGDAVITVLSQADSDLRFVEVHEQVEALLGEPVARSSVKNCLARGCTRRGRAFERVERVELSCFTKCGRGGFFRAPTMKERLDATSCCYLF